jgi:ribosomal protein S27AE
MTRKEKQREYHRAWRERNRELKREHVRKWRERNPNYGSAKRISAQEALAGRPKSQFCELCGEAGNIVFDHSHQSGRFRGWLCGKCNSALGFAKDDPLLLQRMADYVRRHEHHIGQT